MSICEEDGHVEYLEESESCIEYTTSDNSLFNPPKTDFSGATLISNTYENGVGKLQFSKKLTVIPEASFGSYGSTTTGLTSVKLPKSIEFIGQAAFKGCVDLASINIPENVTTINNVAFYNTAISEIVFPDKIDHLNEPCYMCPNLTAVTIGSGVKYLQSNSFGHTDTNHEAIVLYMKPKTPPSIMGNVFNFWKAETKICYYPKGCNAYISWAGDLGKNWSLKEYDF